MRKEVYKVLCPKHIMFGDPSYFEDFSCPHQLFIPALVICIIMFAFNFVGDGLRDALDPKLKK